MRYLPVLPKSPGVRASPEQLCDVCSIFPQANSSTIVGVSEEAKRKWLICFGARHRRAQGCLDFDGGLQGLLRSLLGYMNRLCLASQRLAHRRRRYRQREAKKAEH
jgi:hypothetical protein